MPERKTGETTMRIYHRKVLTRGRSMTNPPTRNRRAFRIRLSVRWVGVVISGFRVMELAILKRFKAATLPARATAV